MAFALTSSSAAAAVLQVAVVSPGTRTIADLDWKAILLCIAVAMFGGLVRTLYEVDKASKDKRDIAVRSQLRLDLLRAVIIALVVWAAFAIMKWEPEALPAVLGLAGMAGQTVINPMLKNLAKAADMLGRPAGKAEE